MTFDADAVRITLMSRRVLDLDRQALPHDDPVTTRERLLARVDDLVGNFRRIISINRKKAAELGISVEEIGRTLDFAYSGRRFGYFLKDGKQY